jgi:hypothetical protein
MKLSDLIVFSCYLHLCHLQPLIQTQWPQKHYEFTQPVTRMQLSLTTSSFCYPQSLQTWRKCTTNFMISLKSTIFLLMMGSTIAEKYINIKEWATICASLVNCSPDVKIRIRVWGWNTNSVIRAWLMKLPNWVKILPEEKLQNWYLVFSEIKPDLKQAWDVADQHWLLQLQTLLLLWQTASLTNFTIIEIPNVVELDTSECNSGKPWNGMTCFKFQLNHTSLCRVSSLSFKGLQPLFNLHLASSFSVVRTLTW